MRAPSQPTEPKARRAPEAGFTLLELLVVVSIIAVTAALATPAIMSALNDRRANEAALDMVRLARRGRSEAAGYGRAYMVRFNNGSNGSAVLWRGNNNGCNTNDWGTIIGSGCEDNAMCVDALELDSSHFQTSSSQVVMTAPTLGATVDVCYEPTGRMLWRTSTTSRFTALNSAGAGDDATNLGGGVRFAFAPQKTDGTADGVTRRVVLPLGGDPRTVR
jgi:prepilin-type N-terminal cleavage/methylation domain-containing protein